MGRAFVRAVLLDTHTWAWTLTDDDHLSGTARAAVLNAETVLVSPITFFEIGQKVRLGKWPQMAPFVQQLSTLLEKQGGVMADLDGPVCLSAATMDWTHRDPFDRLLAATALKRNLPLVSVDPVFDAVVTRIW